MKTRIVMPLILILALLSLGFPVSTLAAAPSNDDFDQAIQITAVPFTYTQDTSEATNAPDDPYCYGERATVWFAYTASASARIIADTFGSNYDTTLSVYTGQRGALSLLTCNDDSFGLQSNVLFDAVAGQTYYFMAAALGNGGGGNLVLSVQAPVPPQNDDFDEAILVGGLPFTDSRDTSAATVAADDPFDCGGFGPLATVWYVYTPATDTHIEANTFNSSFLGVISVWTGSRGNLTQVGCNYQRLRFDAIGSQTYYFMVNNLSGAQGGFANLVFNIQVAPPPLSISVSIANAGSVVPTTGIATVRGTVTCNRPVVIDLDAIVQQKVGNGLIYGQAVNSVWCDAISPPAWSLSTSGYPYAKIGGGRAATLFTAGRADVQVYGFAYDYWSSEVAYSNPHAVVTLRGTR